MRHDELGLCLPALAPIPLSPADAIMDNARRLPALAHADLLQAVAQLVPADAATDTATCRESDPAHNTTRARTCSRTARNHAAWELVGQPVPALSFICLAQGVVHSSEYAISRLQMPHPAHHGSFYRFICPSTQCHLVSYCKKELGYQRMALPTCGLQQQLCLRRVLHIWSSQQGMNSVLWTSHGPFEVPITGSKRHRDPYLIITHGLAFVAIFPEVMVFWENVTPFCTCCLRHTVYVRLLPNIPPFLWNPWRQRYNVERVTPEKKNI